MKEKLIRVEKKPEDVIIVTSDHGGHKGGTCFACGESGWLNGLGYPHTSPLGKPHADLVHKESCPMNEVLDLRGYRTSGEMLYRSADRTKNLFSWSFVAEGVEVGFGLIRGEPECEAGAPKSCAQHISLQITETYRRKGYGTEFLRRLLRAAFEVLSIEPPVILVCEETNTAARKVIESNGGKLTGIHPAESGTMLERFEFHKAL